jgi:intracellular sulfur oxidation DsrE/DsrF family protein
MAKPRILVQLDTDERPSLFDSVVGVDAGVQHLLRYGGVTPENVVPLVHGAIFTRGGDDLRCTAIFLGGSDVARAEAVLAAIRNTFFGPCRVSVMLDPNGANTTAAACVLAVAQHVELSQATAAVLAATGPVGQRVVRLLARQGAQVRVCSRTLARAEEVCRRVGSQVSSARLAPLAASSEAETLSATQGCDVVIAAGAAGAELVSAATCSAWQGVRLAVDLNAVPPAGIALVAPTDKARERQGVLCYGALGVGSAKMKIHRAAVGRLFEANDLVLDAEELYALGQTL